MINLFNLDLSCFYQILSKTGDVWADMFYFVSLDESSIHLVHTCCIVLEYDSWLELLIHLALLC